MNIDTTESHQPWDGFVHVDTPVSQSEAFLRLMSRRRTIRHFSQKKIPEGVLNNAVLTAGSAPSGANLQPWFFAVIESFGTKRRIRMAAEKVETEFYSKNAPKKMLNDLKFLRVTAAKPHLEEAPALVVVFSRTSQPDENDQQKKTYYPIQSTGIAAGLLIASLHNAGLGTLTHTPSPMKFLNEILGLDHSFRPFVIVATGFPKTPILLPKITRKVLSEISEVY